ncbi:hypothetical protein C2S51_026873 [Perilla frutescens var. frutescens]|nr:hypothetical protein C2S51_026873 [Perilla frutescens var. frutescens]
MKQGQVAVIVVPLPAQGHLNQMLQLSCLISSYGQLLVYYVGSAVHNRQARARINGLITPQQVSKIEFHEIVTPPFASPSPDPNSTNKFPSQLMPAWNAALQLRRPLAAFLQEMAMNFERVVVVYDHPMMAAVVQDVSAIVNAESYAFITISAFSALSFIYAGRGEPFPLQHPRELPPYEGWISDEFASFLDLQSEPSDYRVGDIYNTCRFIEAPCMEVLEREEKRKSWAIGPILPPNISSQNHQQHECLEWLDKQNPKSVIYVSFGTTVSLSNEQINEVAHGLEQSKVKFLWVLRDADKGDIFDVEVRRSELPEGFEERVGGEGMVVREWAPQPQILAHPSIGGFMSHCGWNSCLESINMGVAIAAWPMHSDQPRNAALLTDILKISILVREWTQRRELVKASAVESVVRRLMASPEGDEIRKRAEELGGAARRAAQPGGASRLEFDSFIAHITR